MEPVVAFGIVARYDGVCGLCGEPFKEGARIYHLPANRRGSVRRWVCSACRFPDPDRQIDIAFVIRKAEHRMYRIRTGYSPNLAEAELIVAAFATIADLTPDELDVLRQFQFCQVQGRTPTLGHARIEALVGALRRAVQATSPQDDATPNH